MPTRRKKQRSARLKIMLIKYQAREKSRKVKRTIKGLQKPYGTMQKRARITEAHHVPLNKKLSTKKIRFPSLPKRQKFLLQPTRTDALAYKFFGSTKQKNKIVEHCSKTNAFKIVINGRCGVGKSFVAGKISNLFSTVYSIRDIESLAADNLPLPNQKALVVVDPLESIAESALTYIKQNIFTKKCKGKAKPKQQLMSWLFVCESLYELPKTFRFFKSLKSFTIYQPFNSDMMKFLEHSIISTSMVTFFEMQKAITLSMRNFHQLKIVMQELHHNYIRQADTKYTSVFDEAKAILQKHKSLYFLRHPSVLMIKDSMIEECDIESTCKVMESYSFFDCYDSLAYKHEELQSMKFYQSLRHELHVRSTFHCKKPALNLNYPSFHFEQHRTIKRNTEVLNQSKQYYIGISKGACAATKVSLLDQGATCSKRVSILDYLARELDDNSLHSERIVSKIGLQLKTNLNEFLYSSTLEDFINY